MRGIWRGAAIAAIVTGVIGLGAAKRPGALLDAEGRADFAAAKRLAAVPGDPVLVYTARVTPAAPFDIGIPAPPHRGDGTGLQAGTLIQQGGTGGDLSWNVVNDPPSGGIQLPSTDRDALTINRGPYAGLLFTSYAGVSYLVHCHTAAPVGAVRWHSFFDPDGHGDMLVAGSDFAFLIGPARQGGRVNLQVAFHRNDGDGLNRLLGCRLFALRP